MRLRTSSLICPHSLLVRHSHSYREGSVSCQVVQFPGIRADENCGGCLICHSREEKKDNQKPNNKTLNSLSPATLTHFADRTLTVSLVLGGAGGVSLPEKLEGVEVTRSVL